MSDGFWDDIVGDLLSFFPPPLVHFFSLSLLWCSSWVKSLLSIEKNMRVCSVTRSCLTVCDTMDFSPSGSSVHGIFQARILECVAICFSRGFFWPRDQICISCSFCTVRQTFFFFLTTEPPRKLLRRISTHYSLNTYASRVSHLKILVRMKVDNICNAWAVAGT